MAKDLDTLKEEIRARADIIDVIGDAVPLKKAGATYKACCPFHQENTPSFNVNPTKQFYHCFGCGASGDVFTFVSEHYKLDFMGAMEHLANRYNIPFEFDRGAKSSGPSKDRLFDLNNRLAKRYRDLLLHDGEAGPARVYLQERKLAKDTQDDFGIGYALDRYDDVLKWARKQGFTNEELDASGLFSESEKSRQEKRFDRFRGRIMFPIRDEMSRVVGFSGRVLRKEQSPAKYINSPETRLFKKSQILYGIDRARQQIASLRQAVLCEGQLDVIRCHEAGLTQAVAAQGTAITEEHARKLNRYADEVVLLLDADAAGVKAALRSAEHLLGVGLSIRVASMPEGQDPDTLVLSKGAEALHAIISDAEPFMTYQVRVLMEQQADASEASRLRVARDVVETVRFAKQALHRETLIQQAAPALGLSADALRADVEQGAPAPSTSGPRVRVKGTLPPKPVIQVPQPPSPVSAASTQKSKVSEANRALLEVLCNDPAKIDVAQDLIKEDHLTHPASRELYAFIRDSGATSDEDLLDKARDNQRITSWITKLLMGRREVTSEDENDDPGLRAVRDAVLRVRLEALERKLQQEFDAMSLTQGQERIEHETNVWQLTMVKQSLDTAVRESNWDDALPILRLYD